MNFFTFSFSFLSFLLISDVTTHVQGQSDILAVRATVVASTGDDVLLTCYASPQLDLRRFTVDWTLEHPSGHQQYLHIYRNGRQLNISGAGWTRMLTDRLSDGKISLMISNVTPAHSGMYRCSVPKMKGSANQARIQLDVYANVVLTTLTSWTSEIPTKDPEDGSESVDSFTKLVVTVTVVGVLVALILVLATIAIKRRRSEKQCSTEREKRLKLNP